MGGWVERENNMKTEAEIDKLLKIAAEANLEGLDFLSSFTPAQLADGFNGIGPEFLKPRARAAVSGVLHIFKPAALGHDLRNELSDGTRESFHAANEEFLHNCIKLAEYHYAAYPRKLRRAKIAAEILYKFVEAESFGWRAWLEAKERHAAKLSSGNSVWKTKEEK